LGITRKKKEKNSNGRAEALNYRLLTVCQHADIST